MSNKEEETYEDGDDILGDKIEYKDDNNLRISFQNVNSFLADDGDDRLTKARQVYDFMSEHKIDVHAMVEINVNWKCVPKSLTMQELARGWFENKKTSTAFNLHDRICKQSQPGGTAIVSQGELALRWMKAEVDPSNMGRWNSQLFWGKQNLKL